MEKVAFGSVTYGGADASPFTPSPAVFVSANVSMKFPVIYPDATKVWFAQPDAQFAIKYITVSNHPVAIHSTSGGCCAAPQPHPDSTCC